jgi:hypothetical protein
MATRNEVLNKDEETSRELIGRMTVEMLKFYPGTKHGCG